MGALLSNFRNTFIVSLVLAIVLIAVFAGQPNNTSGNMHELMGHAAMRWLHVFFGILWIGLLYYFNFVQIRTMPKIPDELKPAIGKFIAPESVVLVPLGRCGYFGDRHSGRLGTGLFGLFADFERRQWLCFG